MVRSKEIVLESERTTPSAPFIGTGIFLDGASTPPLPRSGVYFAQAFSNIKCVYFNSSSRVPVKNWLKVRWIQSEDAIEFSEGSTYGRLVNGPSGL